MGRAWDAHGPCPLSHSNPSFTLLFTWFRDCSHVPIPMSLLAGPLRVLFPLGKKPLVPSLLEDSPVYHQGSEAQKHSVR